jgi:hypothetical protein
MKVAFSTLPHRDRIPLRHRCQRVGEASGAVETPSHDKSGDEFPTIWTVRGFLLLQIAIFLAMVSIHFGLPRGGYHHQAAGTTELVVTAVLVAGLLLTWTREPLSRRAANAAQAFATMGVLVGLLTIALRIGPRSILDLIVNAVLLLTLIVGLAMTSRKLRT